MDKDFSKLEEKLEIKFKNKNLLKQSVVHRSYLNENPNFNLPHNERLEFLGDAVLELITTEHLYKKYSDPEGVMTNWRSALVNSKMLSKLARKLGIEPFLYMSKGETKDTGRARELILANAFEALIGAIYLDKGLEAARIFIEKNLLKELPKIIEKKLYMDPKSRFQELAQEKTGITPSYEVLKEWGPDHNRHFVVGVYLEKKLMGKGEGCSKQEAQEKAAEEALKSKL